MDDQDRKIELLPGETEIWRGRQWIVTTRGLQPHDENQDYWIEASRLAETRPFSHESRGDWLLHLAEKPWIDLEDFIAAWCVAVLVHRTKLGRVDVMASIEAARKIYIKNRYEQDQLDEYDHRMRPSPAEMAGGELTPSVQKLLASATDLADAALRLRGAGALDSSLPKAKTYAPNSDHGKLSDEVQRRHGPHPGYADRVAERFLDHHKVGMADALKAVHAGYTSPAHAMSQGVIPDRRK
jgi:hypothetical protein